MTLRSAAFITVALLERASCACRRRGGRRRDDPRRESDAHYFVPIGITDSLWRGSTADVGRSLPHAARAAPDGDPRASRWRARRPAPRQLVVARREYRQPELLRGLLRLPLVGRATG